MKLKRFKERDNKRIGIIVFTISCILLVSGVILYRTFAIFEVRTNQNVIKGTVQDPGDIYFAFYQKNEETGDYEIQKDMPAKEKGYVLDEEQSYCGVNGEQNSNIKVSVNEDWKIIVSGVTTSRTKCNLYFTKGKFILGKGIPIVENGDGLYEVFHNTEDTKGMDAGWQQAEYRFAGANPNNYVYFNKELWRIIGLVNVQIENGDIEQRIKIVTKESIGNFAWNSTNKNNWTQASLMNDLNSAYYNNFYEHSKLMIDKNVTWNIGGLSSTTTESVLGFYRGERSVDVYQNNPPIWNNSSENFNGIAIIYASDYGYATSETSCLDGPFLDWWKKALCSQNDWLYHSKEYDWLLTPDRDHSHLAALIDLSYFPTFYNVNESKPVHPSLFIKPNVKIYDGNGTEENPFQLKQEIFE